jgi:crotonobetaine/carnitine-CoA ligase
MMRTDVLQPQLPAQQRTLAAMLERASALFGDRPLLSIGDVHWSHADAKRIAAGRAAALRQAGIAPGARVAVMSGNRAEILEVLCGCGWLGAVIVPVNTASMAPQIEYMLANSTAQLLVIERQYLDRMAGVDAVKVGLKAIWVLEDGSVSPLPIELETKVGVESYPPHAALLPAVDVQPGQALAILYTSGTTGPSKGVISPHGQYFWWSAHSADALGVRQDDVLCTTLPLFHINALNTFGQALLSGCQVVYQSRFSASAFWKTMCDRQASVAYLLGAMVPMLLAQPASALEKSHRVRVALGPGVPADAGAELFRRTGVRLVDGYGSTETSFVLENSLDPPRGGSMGWVRKGFHARVADEHDNEVPDGVAGELLLRADEPYAFAAGYLGMPEKTVEAWRNLWFHTGDRVVRDADGTFRFVDRIKDAIRRRGENISSFEVEQILMSSGHLEEVAVFPVKSELAEDEVMAALILKADREFAPEELIGFCQSRLPYFAVPRYLEALAALPKTPNGKVQKFMLRDRGVTASTWDRGPAPRRSTAKP